MPVSKLILSLNSPVFKVMFKNQMQESATHEIVISDFSEEVVRAMLRYMYGDHNSDETWKGGVVESLLLIADKYEISKLVHSVTNHICQSIDVDNAFHYLEFGDKYNKQSIKTAAMDFIVLNQNEFYSHTDMMQSLGTELLCELLAYQTAHFAVNVRKL